MSAFLKLEISKLSPRSRAGHGAVVTVRQVADGNGRYPDQPFELSVLVEGRESTDRAIALPNGRYRLEARLPGGTVIRTTATLTDGQQSIVQFDLGSSSHDWLAWQTVSGNVPSADDYERRRRKLQYLGGRRKNGSPSSDLSIMGLALTLPSNSLAYSSAENVEPALVRSQFLSARSTMSGWSDHKEIQPDGVIETDDTLVLFKVSFNDVPAQWATPLDEKGQPPSRLMMRTEGEDGIDLAFLPAPWLDREGVPVEFELLYDLTRSDGYPLRVSVIDSDRAALLSYLGASRMVEAAVAFDASPTKYRDFEGQVMVEMEMKRNNPLAAAAAAYVGLVFPPGDVRRDRWSPWLVNLMNWFPGIPDGAILYARDRIDRAKTDQDLKMALEALVTAFQRGPPYFSAGMRHLLEGLSLFVETADRYGYSKQDIALLHAHVSGIALMTDPSQAFTVLTFRGHTSDA